jgi:type III pantothenate kinase
MLLAVDAGNTNTLFAIHDGTTWRAEWRTSTSDTRTADEYMVWLAQLMELEGLKRTDIDGAVIGTVVPQATFNLRTLCKRYFNCNPFVVGDDNLDLGIEIDVDKPEDVGADRLANAVAAHASYENSLIVLDFGTATTFDIVNANGAYAGGIIAPGVNLSVEALHSHAAKLPRIAIQRPDHVIGRSTITAMQSGVYWGYVSMIEGMVARIKKEYGKPMKVIATGGLASIFDNATDVIEVVDRDLTIRGLLEIYNRNAEQRPA